MGTFLQNKSSSSLSSYPCFSKTGFTKGLNLKINEDQRSYSYCIMPTQQIFKYVLNCKIVPIFYTRML